MVGVHHVAVAVTDVLIFVAVWGGLAGGYFAGDALSAHGLARAALMIWVAAISALVANRIGARLEKPYMFTALDEPERGEVLASIYGPDRTADGWSRGQVQLVRLLWPTPRGCSLGAVLLVLLWRAADPGDLQAWIGATAIALFAYAFGNESYGSDHT